jgi:hypothetical protein
MVSKTLHWPLYQSATSAPAMKGMVSGAGSTRILTAPSSVVRSAVAVADAAAAGDFHLDVAPSERATQVFH